MKFFGGLVFLALAAGGFAMQGNSSKTALSSLQMENLEALSENEHNCDNFNGYRRILEGNEKIYDCCYVEQIGKGKDDCRRW